MNIGFNKLSRVGIYILAIIVSIIIMFVFTAIESEIKRNGNYSVILLDISMGLKVVLMVWSFRAIIRIGKKKRITTDQTLGLKDVIHFLP